MQRINPYRISEFSIKSKAGVFRRKRIPETLIKNPIVKSPKTKIVPSLTDKGENCEYQITIGEINKKEAIYLILANVSLL